MPVCFYVFFFFFYGTATTEIYTYLHTLSLHDALPISPVLCLYVHHAFLCSGFILVGWLRDFWWCRHCCSRQQQCAGRSAEHTSELQSLMRTSYAVFCLKKQMYFIHI